LERYGVTCTLHAPGIKEKKEETFLKKYNSKNPSSNSEIKEKRRKTTQEKFGVDNVFQNENVKNKSKETYIIKYGVDNPSKSPEVQERMKKTFMKNLGFDSTVTNALLASKSSAELIQRILEKTDDATAKRVGLWMITAIAENLDGDKQVQTNSTPISDEQFIELSDMVSKNELSSTSAKDVLFEMLKTSDLPRIIAERKNLIQVSDEGEIAAIVDEVLADPASAAAVGDIRAGKDKAIGFLVGQIMKKSKGQANPSLAQKLIRERL
jgi:aspartyl-tRNA(Asn)/glutamyl-tRNA(Gln) amidotransferase subunit B